MVRDSSIAAHREHKRSGRARTQADRIVMVLKTRANMSISELQIAYEKRYDKRIEKSSISGRLNELKADGLVQEDPPRKCMVTDCTVNPVYVRPRRQG